MGEISDRPVQGAGSQELLFSEQVAIAYGGMPGSLAGNIINSSILAFLLWPVADQSILLGWWLFVLAVCLCRGFDAWQYKQNGAAAEARHWARRFSVGAYLGALGWTAAVILLFQPDSIAHQALLAFVIAGTTAGASATLATLWLPGVVYLVLPLTPLAIQFLRLDGEIARGMGLMVTLYLVVLTSVARKIHLNTLQNIRLRIESGLHEAEMQQSEAKFRLLFESVDDAIFIMDAQGQFIDANPVACKWLGYSRDELLGMHVSGLYTPKYATRVAERLEQIKEQGRISFEAEHVRKDGAIIAVEVNAHIAEFKGEQVLFSIVRNLSERKRSEYFIRRTSEILKMVAISSAADEVYDAICRMYERMHPRMRTSILSLKGKQLFHCSAPSLPEEYSRAIDGAEIGPCAGSCGTAAFLGREVIVEDIASDPLWADYRAVALPHNLRACWSEPVVGSDGSILGTFAMYFDQPSRPNDVEFREIRNASGLVAIMMEKERREALLGKLSSAIKQAGESVVITDREGVIEYINPAFTQLTGYTAEESIGQTLRMLKSGHQDAAFYTEMWRTITDGKIWRGKVINRKKDGSLYPAMLTISPIYDQSGDAVDYSHFVGIQADLSRLEDMEQQFHQAQKMEAIGTLVGGIAHDFNNMLAGMTGNLYLAKKRTAGMPDVLQKLDNVEEIAFRASDMIQQLLTFARKDRVSIKQIPLNPFIKETLKLLRASVPENIKMKQDLCSENLQINGDATQFHQVLLNLINNARDAVAGEDNPLITTRLESFRADAAFIDSHAYFKDKLYAHLSIEDNGCGIPEDRIKHLFEPFFTTKEVGKGTGLGLSMVFGAIKTHHGFVEVESSEGEGSIFHIYIPLLHAQAVDFASAQKQEEAKGHGELILLVDDEPQIIETGREVLESLGYRVLTATDGQQAVEIFEARPQEIDLCILDVVMPLMGGDKAAQRIRRIKPQVKIIFSTGYDKNLQSDMDGETVLSKPFPIDEMSQMIRQQLDS